MIDCPKYTKVTGLPSYRSSENDSTPKTMQTIPNLKLFKLFKKDNEIVRHYALKIENFIEQGLYKGYSSLMYLNVMNSLLVAYRAKIKRIP